MTETMKRDQIAARIKKGNSKAEMVAEYINYRFNEGLVPASFQEDVHEKKDYLWPDGKSGQVKVRDQREDIIHEMRKFKKQSAFRGKVVTKATKFDVKPGRDALCQADLYLCKPRVKPDQLDRIDIANTKDVKTLAEQAEKEWLSKNPDIKLDDAFAYENWKLAQLYHSKRVHLYTAANGVELYFKIDEGRDTDPYAKLIAFVPPKAIKDAGFYLRVIEAREGEEILNPDSWI